MAQTWVAAAPQAGGGGDAGCRYFVTRKESQFDVEPSTWLLPAIENRIR
jgi:hypothetical protein